MSGGTLRYGTGNGLDNIMINAGGSASLSGLDGNDALYGGVANDTLLGGNGTDVLSGGLGTNRLSGGIGADLFAFARQLAGIERDTITDFVAIGASHDTLTIGSQLAADFSFLVSQHAIAQSGRNTVLTLASNEIVTLLNVDSHQLSAADFMFV